MAREKVVPNDQVISGGLGTQYAIVPDRGDGRGRAQARRLPVADL
jgi:hypothetical protein